MSKNQRQKTKAAHTSSTPTAPAIVTASSASAKNLGWWRWIKDTTATAFSTTTTWISAHFNPVLQNQAKLESTKTYHAYAAARYVAMPLLTKPWPIALTQIAWNVSAYNTLAVVYKYLPARAQTILQFGMNVYRFADDQAMAVAHWMGLLLLQQKWVRKRIPLELRAWIYIAIRETPTLYRAVQPDTLSQQLQRLSHVSSPKQIAEQYFHIRLNGQPLNQTRCIVFLNNHLNQTHTELGTWLIAATGKPGDQVLVEGFQTMRPLPCDRLNSIVSDDSKAEWKTISANHNPTISTELTCHGLDNMQEVFLVSKRNEYLKLLESQLRKMNDETSSERCSYFFNLILGRSGLGKDDPVRIYAANFCALFPLTKKVISKAHEIRSDMAKQLDVGVIGNRNQAFMETYKKLASENKRTYLLFGSSHYLPDGAETSTCPYDTKVNDADIRHALREFLDAEQCAIFMPK